MKRKEIINKLLKEGFSEKTLVNFTDNQLKTLSSRILRESDVMISKKDPKMSEKLDQAKKENKSIETYESKNLKGGQKKLDKNKNGKLDSKDFEILRKKKSEVKENDNLKTKKVVKPIDKLKDPHGSMKNKRKSVGLNNKKKSEVKEWVQKLAEEKYHGFTSKNEIMEMIKNKMNEQEFGSKVKKGHNNVPEFMSYDSIKSSDVEVIPSKPKVEPGQKPKRLSPFKDKPLVKPKPQAGVEVIPSKPKVEPGQKPKRLSPVKDKPLVIPKPKAGLVSETKNKNRKK